jgi:hypothetical protein
MTINKSPGHAIKRTVIYPPSLVFSCVIWQRRCCNYCRTSTTSRKLYIDNIKHFILRSALKYQIHK